MAWAAVASVSDVTDKGVVAAQIGAERIALFALDGEIYATGNICTHQFALLTDGFVEDGCVECPLHQGLFDIRTGKAQGAPVSEDIPTYAVRIEDGTVYVDLEQPAQTAKAQADAPAATPAAKTGEKIVIIGAGQAGGRAAEAIRQAGFAGTVTLVGEESHAPYERPPLSKEILLGSATAESAALFSADKLTELDIDLVTGTRVEAIDRTAKTVTLADGQTLSYDRLMIATGARPRELTVPGAESAPIHSLRTLDDAARLGPALAPGRRIAIIGGGFIGLEIASAAVARGASAVVLEREERIMSRVLPAEASAEIAHRAHKAGVEILTGVTATEITTDENGTVIRLDDGRKIPADAIVVGIGAIPNTELAEAAGLAINGGIVVDAAGRTSDPHVFAAGDVTTYPHAPRERPVRLESWHNAQEQAIAAGRTMAGKPTNDTTIPWFWSDQFGGTVQMIGLTLDGARMLRREAERPGAFTLYSLDEDGRVVGAIAFDDPEGIRHARHLMADGLTLETDDDETERQDEMAGSLSNRYVWPAEGLERIPDWVYTDEDIYQREVERIFHGPTWNYVALEAEIPNPGDFVRSHVGPTPVVVVRGNDGAINVLENRCAHRAAEFCRAQRGNETEFVCPYHQWSYDLEGNLAGVPFRRGVGGKGGMGADFKPEEHGLRKLNVATRRGVVFASFHDDMPSLEDYMTPEILKDFDATFDGRELKILGYYRNTLPGNWKLYHENLKDPYHATLLHTFLVTFGLLVAGNKSAMVCDPTGRHGTMASAKSDGKAVSEDARKEMRAYQEGMGLEEPRFMDFVEEFDSPWSVTMQTIWPNLVVQREMNTLGVRQIVPQGPNEFVMNWTMFGFADDDEEMTRHRLRQGNLMGPAGFLGMEDNEAMKFVQDGMLRTPGGEHLVALDPETPIGTSDTLISEAAIRAMYKYWREEMGL